MGWLRITRETAEQKETKLDWQSQKEKQAQERKIKNKINKLEREIEETENKISLLEEKLNSAEIATDAAKAQEVFEEKESLEEKLMALMDQWEEAQLQ